SVREASSKFASFTKSQKAISSRSKWTQFGSTRPSIVAASVGNEKDLLIFDHAAAVFETAGKYGQISLGTVVEVSPNNWRMLELPEVVGEGEVVKNGGLFYPDLQGNGGNAIADGGGSLGTQALIKLFEKYESLEKKLGNARAASEIAKLEKERAELFMQLATESPQKDEKENWIRQMADTVTSAYQTNSFPGGIEFLQKQVAKIKSMGLSNQLAYMQWRIIYSEFLVGHQNGDRRTRTRANDKYIADLETFADEFPESSFAADALFQLGLNAEVADRDDPEKAIDWYKQCRKAFPNTVFGKKAAGALVRLTSTGKSLPFKGTTINGRRFDLQSSQFRGKIVVIHYWETACDTCIDGFEELQRLGAKYKKEVQIIGANLDESPNDLKRFLTRNRSVNWPQLHAAGGAEKSPLAIQLGVATLPMALLVDQRGQLIESNIPVDDLDREIQRLIRRATGQANLNKSTR
ncbi:MAG: TlpA disulfide reductase family protein, partial [Planctomycetota bacterium]